MTDANTGCGEGASLVSLSGLGLGRAVVVAQVLDSNHPPGKECLHQSPQVPVWEGRCPMPVARLYPFCRAVGVREHPRELHERNHGEPLGVEGIRCFRVEQSNYPHLAVIGGNQQ
jgi:hypothetical protein